MRYRVSYAEVAVREDGLVEVVVDDHLEVDAAMAGEFADLFARIADRPTAILIHKVNSYAMTFKAARILSQLPNLVASAILPYSRVAHMVADASVLMGGNIHVFTSALDAAEWLRTQVAAQHRRQAGTA